MEQNSCDCSRVDVLLNDIPSRAQEQALQVTTTVQRKYVVLVLISRFEFLGAKQKGTYPLDVAIIKTIDTTRTGAACSRGRFKTGFTGAHTFTRTSTTVAMERILRKERRPQQKREAGWK
jgi:hypothetical protein